MEYFFLRKGHGSILRQSFLIVLSADDLYEVSQLHSILIIVVMCRFNLLSPLTPFKQKRKNFHATVELVIQQFANLVCFSYIDRKSTRLNSSHGYISYP